VFPHVSIGSLELISPSPEFTEARTSVNNIDHNIFFDISHLLDQNLADEYAVLSLANTKVKTHLDHFSSSTNSLERFIRKKTPSTSSQTDKCTRTPKSRKEN
jgi:t-SNARE complex subunit (syntaxin)